jgi:hypothetical protein
MSRSERILVYIYIYMYACKFVVYVSVVSYRNKDFDEHSCCVYSERMT